MKEQRNATFVVSPNNIDQPVSVQVACGIMDDDDAEKIPLGEPEGISMSRIWLPEQMRTRHRALSPAPPRALAKIERHPKWPIKYAAAGRFAQNNSSRLL